MALATVLHHSYGRVHTENGASRSQNTATRARRVGESDEKKYTAKFRKTPPLALLPPSPRSRSSSSCTRKTRRFPATMSG